MRHSIAFLSIVVLLTGSQSFGGPTLGPFQDYKAHLDPSPVPIPALTIGDKDPKSKWAKDFALIDLPIGYSSVDLRGVMYVSPEPADFSGNIVFTTMYGIDLDPSSAALQIGGFNPVSPEVALISGETIIGKSGTSYPSSFGATSTLADLPAVLPGFDLSPFVGAPSSFVYFFQTMAPATDFPITVPEPATLALAGMGALALFAAARRRARDSRLVG